MSVRIIHGDMLAELPKLDADSIDSAVTDPPYHLTSIVKRFGAVSLDDDTETSKRSRGRVDGYARAARGFMGKTWDGGDIALRPETWETVWRVLKPGAHLLAFGGTRTFHRLVCAIEDAGFEVRDTISWVFASGFPKSHDVSKAIDRAAGAQREVTGSQSNFGRSKLADGKTDYGDYAGEWNTTVPATDDARQWSGWGTALKPAMELICVARKPLGKRTIAANVLAFGTGALNIDACRIPTNSESGQSVSSEANGSGCGSPELLGLRQADDEMEESITARETASDLRSEMSINDDAWITQSELVGRGLEGSPDRIPSGEHRLSERSGQGIAAGSDTQGISGTSVGDGADGEPPVAVRGARSSHKRDQRRQHAGEPDLNGLGATFARTPGNGTPLVGNGSSQPSVDLNGLVEPLARWPANVCHDGSEEVLAGFPETNGSANVRMNRPDAGVVPFTSAPNGVRESFRFADNGNAARFFYTAKADASDRQGSKHPTVKPTDLMRWLVKLVTPPGGTVLDPFCGTGSTLVAADQLQFNAIGIEQDTTYAEDARRKFVRDAGLFASLSTGAG